MAQVKKKTLAVRQLGGSNVHTISADEKGNVVISYAKPGSFPRSFVLFNPQGVSSEDGGGAAVFPNASQGISLK